MEIQIVKSVKNNIRWILPLIAVLDGVIFASSIPDISYLRSVYCMEGQYYCSLLFKPIAVIIAFIVMTFLFFLLAFLLDLLFAVYRKILNWNYVYHLPKIKHWFILPRENDLRLCIQNPRWAKKVFVECSFKKYLTTRGEDYILSNHRNLTLVEDIGKKALFSDTLNHNDIRIIQLGEACQGKLSLITDQSKFSGFFDGKFEYIISCEGKYFGEDFELPDFEIWLTIKNGVLVEIQENI